MIEKMMLIEHVLVVFSVVTVGYLVVLSAALFAQLLDVDHTCSDCKTRYEWFRRMLLCAPSTGINSFPESCYNLHRGVFHNVNILYFELFFILILFGLFLGHSVHLLADGYDIFDCFVVDVLRGAISAMVGSIERYI